MEFAYVPIEQLILNQLSSRGCNSREDTPKTKEEMLTATSPWFGLEGHLQSRSRRRT
jgi:hypothetical protein